MDVALIV